VGVHAGKDELDGRGVGSLTLLEERAPTARHPLASGVLPDGCEVAVGKDDVEAGEEAHVLEHRTGASLLHLLGDLHVHPVEVGDAVVAGQVLVDDLHALDNFADGIGRFGDVEQGVHE
jgi:hypothetical protein